MGTFLRVFALLCFLLATFVALGPVSTTWTPALVPAGLAFWVGSTFDYSRGR